MFQHRIIKGFETLRYKSLQRGSFYTYFVIPPLSTRTVRHIIARAGDRALIIEPVHPHQLRHACGYYLASLGHDTRAIQDYLGHKNIHHTVRYRQMSPQRFESFWTD